MAGAPQDPLGALLGTDCSGSYFEIQSALCDRFDPQNKTLRCTPPGGKGEVFVNVGNFDVVSIAELRRRVRELPSIPGTVKTKQTVEQYIQDIHATAQQGTVIQVASQMNCLEFANPRLTPEDGLGIYLKDNTQGPACALSCLGATAYRTYLLPMAHHQLGQQKNQQLDLSAELHDVLLKHLPHKPLPGTRLWTVRNGYLQADPDFLAVANEQLQATFQNRRADLVGAIRIGVQTGAEVTLPQPSKRCVTQVFTSAVPLKSKLDSELLAPIAELFLEAAYEGAWLVAALEVHRLGHSTTLYTTCVGGGAFGNPTSWIASAKAAVQKSTSHLTHLVEEIEVVLPARTTTPNITQLLTDYAATVAEPKATHGHPPFGAEDLPTPRPSIQVQPERHIHHQHSRPCPTFESMLPQQAPARVGVAQHRRSMTPSVGVGPLGSQRSGTPSGRRARSVSIRVATINLLAEFAYRKYAKCEPMKCDDRRRLCVDTIEERLPQLDALFLQEMDKWVFDHIPWRARNWYVIFPDTRNGMVSAIAINCQTLEPAGQGRVEYLGYRRDAPNQLVKHKASNVHTVLLSVHAPHYPTPNERQRFLGQIHRLAVPGRSFIIGGDFNCDVDELRSVFGPPWSTTTSDAPTARTASDTRVNYDHFCFFGVTASPVQATPSKWESLLPHAAGALLPKEKPWFSDHALLEATFFFQ